MLQHRTLPLPAIRGLLLGAVVLVLSGCVASPFAGRAEIDRGFDAAQALSAPERIGEAVIWGGRVVGVVNAGEFTELEVLALPLRSGDRPDRRADGSTRFVIRHPGFLEPMTFAPGRYVTVLGRYVGIEPRSVGAFSLRHPVVQSQQLELWPVEPNSSRADVHFGFGLGIRL